MIESAGTSPSSLLVWVHTSTFLPDHQCIRHVTGAQYNESIRSTFRRFVEEYTPDGTLGRLGFGVVTASLGAYMLVLSVGFLVNPELASWVIVPTTAVAGVVFGLVTLLTVWPTYLAAIGRIDAPTEYSKTLRTQSSPASTPLEQLKAEYRQGQLSETEFERAVEHLFDGSDESQLETGTTQLSHEGQLAESERSA